MSNYYFPVELWLEIKSYLLLDDITYKILINLSNYSINKFLQNFIFNAKETRIIKNSRFILLIRKKFIINILLTRCRDKIQKLDIVKQIQHAIDKQLTNLRWKNEYSIGEQVLVYNKIKFENVDRFIKQKALVIKINTKSVTLTLFKYNIQPKINGESFNRIRWLQEFESKKLLVFDKYRLVQLNPYYYHLFVEGKFYN